MSGVADIEEGAGGALHINQRAFVDTPLAINSKLQTTTFGFGF